MMVSEVGWGEEVRGGIALHCWRALGGEDEEEGRRERMMGGRCVERWLMLEGIMAGEWWGDGWVADA